MNIEFVGSPNREPRHGEKICLNVIHATVGGYAGSLSWLKNPASQASCHYLIRKDGHIAQLVRDEDAAWHAGKSNYLKFGITGRAGNDLLVKQSVAVKRRSIGIELENLFGAKLRNEKGQFYIHGIDPYPEAQIAALVWLCKDLERKYPGIEHVRHLDIALPKGRKSDPAHFDWNGFLARLRG